MALINCPECDKEISDKAISCPHCGNPMNQPVQDEEYLCCPKCHSRELHTEQKGFSGGKAFAGAVVAGGIGLLAGTIGSKDVQITCLKCGNRFKAGDSYIDKKSFETKHNVELPKGINVSKREFFSKYNYKCPLCNKIYNGDLNSCPKCGRHFLDSDKTNESTLGTKNAGCASVILLFILLGSAIYMIC